MNHAISPIVTHLKNLFLNEEGQDLVEYALVVALIALAATAALLVSMESGTSRRSASARKASPTRASSSASETGVADGRVDSPPISTMSHPATTMLLGCAMAASNA